MKIIRTFGLLLALAAIGTLISGCGKGPSGKYVDDSGALSMEFRSGGKVDLKLGGLTHEADYTVDGNKVTLKYGSDTTVVTMKDDGSLDAGPLGTLKKK